MLVANCLIFVAYGLRYNVIVYSFRNGVSYIKYRAILYPYSITKGFLNVCKIWFASMQSNRVMKASESFAQPMPPREHSESFATSLILVISQSPQVFIAYNKRISTYRVWSDRFSFTNKSVIWTRDNLDSKEKHKLKIRPPTKHQ